VQGGEQSSCPPPDILSSYAHGILPYDEAPSIKRHLETCLSCREYVKQLEIVLSVTRVPQTSDPGDSFNESLWHGIRTERTKRRARLALYPALAAAAVALVILLPLSRNGMRVNDQELVEQLELFQHIELLENLDLVESIDLIMSDEDIEESS
jgi:hypothetical protein